MHAAFFFSSRVLRFRYGPAHPFQLERLGDLMRLLRACAFLPREGSPIESHPCARTELEAFHDGRYIDALESTAREGFRELPCFGLGDADNPVFPGLWSYVLLVAGGSIEAARWILSEPVGGEPPRAFHPAGGLHHAHANRASGFCYVNDVVLAIQQFVAAGRRVLYVDIDAHHGDGVQEAFYATDRVLTVSIHQDGRTIFPGTGFPNESGQGVGEGYAVNVPVLPGASDPDYDRFMEEILQPLLEKFRPDILVTEIGVDALRDDPLTLLDWTLGGLDRFLLWADGTGLPWLALGGGGYRRWNVIRGWSLVWARMIRQPIPAERPMADEAGSLPESWPTHLFDEPPPRAICDREMRMTHFDEVQAILAQRVFPLIRGGG